jgi:hypothetical protein
MNYAASKVVRFPVSVSLPIASTAMDLSAFIGYAIDYVTGQ